MHDDYFVLHRDGETIELSWDGAIAYLWIGPVLMRGWWCGLEW